MTGEMCYRLAEWKPGGNFVPCDDATGIGVTFDPKTSTESQTGKLYSAEEF